MNVVLENEKIKVKSEYNKDFIKKAKMIQGKWDNPYWVFPEDNREEVKELLLDVYGDCAELADEPVNTVTVEINLDEYDKSNYYDNNLKLDTLTIAHRSSRDSDVILHENVMCISGGFSNSGGSVRNPAIGRAMDGTVLRIKKLPIRIFDRIKDEKGIRLVSDIDKKILIEEKERLIARIEAIDELLKKYCEK